MLLIGEALHFLSETMVKILAGTHAAGVLIEYFNHFQVGFAQGETRMKAVKKNIAICCCF
jgi:hypothetical protein